MAPSPLYAPPPAAPRRRPPRRRPTAWILSSLVLTALAIVPRDWLPSLAPQPQQHQSAQSWGLPSAQAPQTCGAMVNADQRLSRGQLTQFLSIAQDASQSTIHGAIAPPYCSLSKSNETYQQEAYPLAFDPDTWFVVNYHQGIYKGYDFVFKR